MGLSKTHVRENGLFREIHYGRIDLCKRHNAHSILKKRHAESL